MRIASLSSSDEDNGLVGKTSFSFPRRFSGGLFSHFYNEGIDATNSPCHCSVAGDNLWYDSHY